MISFLVGLGGACLSLIGWFGFRSIILLLVGTALHLVETLIEFKQLTASAKMMDIVIFAIGCIVALFIASIPWYVGGILAIAIYSLITSIIGLIMLLKLAR